MTTTLPAPTLFRHLRFLGIAALLLFAEFVVLRVVDGLWNHAALAHASWPALLSALGTGLRFDFAALAMLLAVPALLLLMPLPRRCERARYLLATAVLLLTALPLFAMAWVDVELLRFTRARMTPATLFLFGEGDLRLTDLLRDYWLLIMISMAAVLALASALIALCRRALRLAIADANFLWTWLYPLIALLLVAAVLVIAARGGVSNSKPLNTVDTDPDLNLGNWALNTPFVFIKGARAAKFSVPVYFTDQQQLLSLLNGSDSTPSVIGSYRQSGKLNAPQNVVVIIMESLSSGYMGESGGAPSFTPFLDEMWQRGLSFQGLANAHRSIDGIPAVLAAIPALAPEPFLVSPYANAAFTGMGTTLADQGYTTAFFHGAKRGSMFFDKFALRAGFQHHYSREDYPRPEDADVSWGIPDEPFFQWVVDKADAMHGQGKPFALAMFSLSAHFPFNVPEQYRATLPQGSMKMLQSQAYADLALRRFFERAAKSDWFKNTLFVITADHGTTQYRPASLQDPLGEWWIPVIFYHPSLTLPKVATADPIQQIDILPSILDFLDIKPQCAMPLGRSVFIAGPRVAVVRVGDGYYAVQGEHVVFEADGGGKPVATLRGGTTPDSDSPPELLERAHAAEQYFYQALQRRELGVRDQKTDDR